MPSTGAIRDCPPLCCCWAAALTAASLVCFTAGSFIFTTKHLQCVIWNPRTLNKCAGEGQFPKCYFICAYSSSLYTHSRENDLSQGDVCWVSNQKPVTVSLCLADLLPLCHRVWKVLVYWAEGRAVSRCKNKFCTWQKAVPGLCQFSRMI